MPLSRRRLAPLALAAAALLSTTGVRGDGSASTLPFTQNWANTGLITTANTWTGVVSIEGFQNQDASTTAAIDPRTVVAPSTNLHVLANQTNPNTNTSGGVGEFDTLADPVVALQGSGTADAPNLVITLNTIGVTSINVAYNVRDIDGSLDNAIQAVALQYRVGTVANFTDLPAGYVVDATTGPSLATLVTPVSVTLPGAADNQSTVQVRVITGNAAGSDEWVGIDDISITGTTGGGASLSVSSAGDLPEGNAGTSNATFTVSLSAPAPPGGVTFDIATEDGTATTANIDYVAQSLTGQSIPAGSTQYTFDVTVNGDATFEPNETFKVKVTNVVGAAVSSSEATATITNDDVATIHDLQGTGAASSFDGQVVTVEGVVTAVKNTGSSSAYFLQVPDADADANPLTSEAIVVFRGGAGIPVGAVVGNMIRITGTVDEFAGDAFSPSLTEIVSSSTPIVLSQANPMPAAITIAPGALTTSGGMNQLEHLEAMRVHVASLDVVAPTQGSITESTATSTSNGVFYAVLPGTARPFREAGIRTPDPVPTPAPANVPRFDNNPERLRVDSDATGHAALDVAVGQSVSDVTGVLDYGFRTYTIDIDPSSPAAVVGPAPAATPLPAPAANQITVANSNLFHFFDDVDDPTTEDNASILTPAAYALRLQKVSLAIRTVLLMPDIIGLQEVEKLSVLQDLADQINADAIAAGGTDPAYVARLVEAHVDPGGIDVGFLVKSSRVVIVSTEQVLTDATFINPTTGLPEKTFDRPPFVLVASVTTGVGTEVPLTVIVNHLRSLNGIDGSSASAHRVRVKRRAGAEALAAYVQGRQDADPLEKFVLVGDFNAFEVNDGYVDVMGTLVGVPAPADMVTLASADVVTPNFTLLAHTDPLQRYSYSFDGNAQILDHILTSANLATLAPVLHYAHTNADMPGTFYGDGTRPERFSDHDVPVAYFSVPVVSVDDVPSVAEAAGTATVTVRLSAAQPGDVTVGWATSDGSALAASDYTASSGTLTFVAGDTEETISVAITNDTRDEPAQSFAVTLSNPTGSIALGDATGEVTIEDDDSAPTVSVTGASVLEGVSGSTSIQLTVALSAPSEHTASVDYSTANGTALSPADYSATLGTLTFSPLVTSLPVTVTVNGDAIDEFDEQFSLTLTNPVSLTLGTAVAQGTILDDENPSRTTFGTDPRPTLLWQNNADGRVGLWFMGANATLESSRLFNPGVVANLNWRLVGAADFGAVGAQPQDGKTDLLWRNFATGEMLVWYMNGADRTGFAFLPTASTLTWRVAGTADMNGDGWPDILWQNGTTGALLVWYMEGATRPSFESLDPSSASTAWKVVGVRDMNGDLKPDLIWHSQVDGRMVVWLMNGAVRQDFKFINPDQVPDTNWKIYSVTDLNLDGHADLVFWNRSTGALAVWYLDGINRTSRTLMTPSSLTDFNWDLAGPR